MSVLLEALKKAALEKRTRDESPDAGESAAPLPELRAIGSEAVAEAVAPAAEEPLPPRPVVATAAADYLAQQETKRAHRAFAALDEAAEATFPANGVEPVAVTPEPGPESLPENGEDIDTGAPGSDGNQWNDEDLDETPEEAVGEMPEPTPAADEFSLPEHATEKAELIANHNPSGGLPDRDAHEEDLDLDLDTAAAAEFDVAATEAIAGQGPEVNPAAAAGVDQAEQRRAMQTLIGRSRDVLQRSKRRGNYMHAALLVTSVVAIGLYYWVLSHSKGLQMPEPLIVSEPVEVAVQAVQPEAPQAAPIVAGAAAASEPAVAVIEAVSTEAPAATAISESPVRESAPVTREPVALVEPVRDAVRARAEPGPVSHSRVLVERRQTPRPLARKVKDGYRAYQGGDFDRAAQLYREVLEESPRQRDALLGAAAIAVQRGRYQEALRLYQRRLVDDSSDHFARAGLLALAGQGVADPELQSEVKILLDDYPRQAHLHFLLGSLQAAAGSWPDAQRSFFEARSWDRDNPDYAYNLAVSLEHLRQPTQALAQYRQALELAQSTTPQFDTGVAGRRVAYLEARQP